MLERANKVDTTLANLCKKNTHKIRNEEGGTKNSINIFLIVRKCYAFLYANTFLKYNAMDAFSLQKI